MIYWCLLNGYILISLLQQGQTEPKISNATCEDMVVEAGLKTVHCEGGILTYIRNNTIPNDTEAIHLSEMTYLIVEPNFLSDNFYDLKKIVMYRTIIVDMLNVKRAPDWYSNMLKKFFADTKIVEIRMQWCKLNDEDNFTYPSTIRVLDLSNNNYHVIDVRGYEELESVIVENNLLESLPRFSNPAPSIRLLNLNKNPLSNLTVDEFAPLCGLKTLEIKPHFESILLKSAGTCECSRIKNWTMEVNITLIGLLCDTDSNGTADCSNYTLDEARKIRQNCFTLSTGPPFIFRIFKRYTYRILSVLVLLFVFIIAVYTIYKMYASVRAGKTESRGRHTHTSSITHEESDSEA